MDITIEKLIYGGEGLAHHDGSTVFVPFVLPAERVAAAPVETKKKFVRARVERVLDPSPQRAAPRCPHFSVCGGCDYQHIPYAEQLIYKTEILRETLRRLGRIDWQNEIATHASPPWAYRNRAQWKVRPLEKAERANGSESDETLAIGYLRAGSSALCSVDDCSILSPLLLKTLLSLRDALAAGKLPRSLREIEAVADARDERLLLTATFAGFPSRAAERIALLRQIAPEAQSILFHDPGNDRMQLDGPGYIDFASTGASYRVGHFSFFQVNRFLAEELAAHVSAGLQEAGPAESNGGLAIDLFAGVGLFSLPLARHFDRVMAVESNPAAVRDLEANARAASNIEVRSSEVESFLAKYKGSPDLVVLDPPRAGLAPEAAKHLARIGPARITYVSCEPPTLARDLATLVQGGYEITAVHLFDLFPQTFHLETVVHLRRHA